MLAILPWLTVSMLSSCTDCTWMRTSHMATGLAAPQVLMAGKREGTVRLKNLMMELRKCCNHPYLFSNGGPPEAIDDYQAALQVG